jgi:hypothetical protein
VGRDLIKRQTDVVPPTWDVVADLSAPGVSMPTLRKRLSGFIDEIESGRMQRELDLDS